MATRAFLLPCALLLALARGPAAGQEPVPGDPDYVPDEQAVEEAIAAAGDGDAAELDPSAWEAALAEAAGSLPDPAPPAAAEVREFRQGLEAHWRGNLPQLLGYLNGLDPLSAENPDPPETDSVSVWTPQPTRDELGRVVKTREQKRNEWRRRVEDRIEELAAQ